MNNDHSSETRLSEALGRLATQSRRSAPPEVGAALADAFRRKQTSRRRTRTMRFTAIAALLCFAVGAAFLARGSHPRQDMIAGSVQTPAVAVNMTDSPRSDSRSGLAAQPAPIHRKQIHRIRPVRAARFAERSSDFMLLPGWSSAAPSEELRIVRMELPASSLRMVGAPVSEEVSEQRVLADFVVGQDGTPYAMRLVQQ